MNYGAAIDLACSLLRIDDASSSISEAIELTRELIPLALEEYGPHGAVTNKLRHILALALCSLPRLSLDSMIEGEAILKAVIRVSARARRARASGRAGSIPKTRDPRVLGGGGGTKVRSGGKAPG